MLAKSYLIAAWARSEILVRKIKFLDAQGAMMATSVYTAGSRLNLPVLFTDHDSSESSMNASCIFRDAIATVQRKVG